MRIPSGFADSHRGPSVPVCTSTTLGRRHARQSVVLNPDMASRGGSNTQRDRGPRMYGRRHALHRAYLLPLLGRSKPLAASASPLAASASPDAEEAGGVGLTVAGLSASLRHRGHLENRVRVATSTVEATDHSRGCRECHLAHLIWTVRDLPAPVDGPWGDFPTKASSACRGFEGLRPRSVGERAAIRGQ